MIEIAKNVLLVTGIIFMELTFLANILLNALLGSGDSDKSFARGAVSGFPGAMYHAPNFSLFFLLFFLLLSRVRAASNVLVQGP